MASELYNAMGTSANNEQVQQNPREQAMNLLKQRGINVPDNIANNPNAIIQHLIQSGQVPQGRLQMAQQMMQRIFRR
jgi:RIO-like serine/threonine protein kinase